MIPRREAAIAKYYAPCEPQSGAFCCYIIKIFNGGAAPEPVE